MRYVEQTEFQYLVHMVILLTFSNNVCKKKQESNNFK